MSSTFVASVMWLLFFLSTAYIKVWFLHQPEFVYYFRLIFILVILGYEVFKILHGTHINRFNLFIIYYICLVLQYLLLLSGLEKIIQLGAIPITFALIKKYPMSKRELSILFYLFVASVLLKIVNGATVETMSDESKFNPTECAISLTCLFCVCFVCLMSTKRIMYLLIAVVCFALQFYFRSRGALLGCVLFILLFILCRKKMMRKNTAFYLILFFSILGVVIAYIYAEVLFPLIGNGKIVILGKDLFTGRQNIWIMTFETIKDNLWIGVGSELNADLVEATQNSVYMKAHNQALGILAAFGVINFTLFYILFAKALARPDNEIKRVYSIPIIFILVITIMNYFEILFFYYWALPMVFVTYACILNYSRIDLRVKKNNGIRNAVS